jgi:2-keto-4-pentenoate hydratase/2-oxohepta-3-ene-1,7-dioic acid hydratase in catechol pathway
MRLVTYAARDDAGPGRLGVVVERDQTAVLDAADLLGDGPWTMARLLGEGPAATARLAAAVGAAGGRAAVPLDEVSLRAPIDRPPKIIAVGRNYREHAAEEGAQVVEDPVLVTKYPSAVVGPGADVTWRVSVSSQVDYEAELGVVIGRVARDVPGDRALDVVFGYTCLNDVSARDLQVKDGQWVRAKSLDTFCPLGPWVVTADEITDPNALRITCDVNGERRQDASTADMVHGVRELIAFCSSMFTLEPGDLIATGTPGGVGAFRHPPVFLADGDVVRVAIEGVGELENRCRVLPG